MRATAKGNATNSRLHLKEESVLSHLKLGLKWLIPCGGGEQLSPTKVVQMLHAKGIIIPSLALWSNPAQQV